MRAPSIRVRVALVLTAALVPTVLAVPGVAAAASPTAAPTAAAPFGPLPARPTCATTTPELRYLVLVPAGSPAPLVRAGIALACGRTTAYYPQIGVVVATSRDAAFDDRLGLDRAYSAQAEAIGGTHPGAGGSTDDGEATVGADRSAATATSIAADRSLEQWDMTQIRAQQANAVNPGRADVVVGVLDSGVDQDHPDLVGAIDPALSAGCTSGAADPSPAAWAYTTSDHGTHVAGTIAAAHDGAGTTGVAPGVSLAIIKVVDDDGFIYPEHAVCGFMWAATHGVDVTNNSYFVDPWEFTCADVRGQAVAHEAVRRAVAFADAAGVVNVASAGNSRYDLANKTTDSASPNNGTPVAGRPITAACADLPTELPGVVTVSATGAQRVKSGYSNYGANVIDVAGPGGDVDQLSPFSPSGCVLSTVVDGYGYKCGTSMAGPHVAGVAALLVSTHPGATPAQIRTLLGNQATPQACPAVYDTPAQCTGRYQSDNSFYGRGIVDALRAVQR